MTEPVAGFGQPAVTVVEISDPTLASRGVDGLDLDVMQLRSAPFAARRIVVRLDGVVVIYHSVSHRLRTRTKLLPGFLAFTTLGPGSEGTVNGLPLRPEVMLAFGAETEVAFVVEPGYESVAFLVPPEEIRAQWSDRRRDGSFRPPRGIETLRANPGMVRRLFNSGKMLAESAARRPEVFDTRREVRAAARVEMVENLLSTLGETSGIEPDRADRALQSKSLVVKRAEEYALSHMNAPVYVGALCQAVGVSERTLEYAFRSVVALTPMAYLIRLRLHRVREVLLAETHGSTTVSAVALDWGFWHFGEFSRAYKRCFGERPSDTLRRRAGPDEISS